MKIKRFFFLLFVFFVYIFIYYLSSSGISSTVNSESSELITRAEFVHLLCRVKNFELYLPEESALISPKQFYKAETSFLSTQGIFVFLNTDRKTNLTRGELVESLYPLVVAQPEEMNTAKKLCFLVKKDIIKKGKINQWVSKKEVISALNTPLLSEMTAETYISPHSFSSSKVISNISAYPNPVTTKKNNTTLTYKLNENAPVDITVYDLMGYEMKHFEFKAGEKGAQRGENRIIWDCTDIRGRSVMKGGYLCRIVVHSSRGKKVVIKKIGIIP